MSLPLILLILLVPAVLAYGVHHYSGYRAGGLYDRLAARDAARRAGVPVGVFATDETFARFLADPRTPRESARV